MFVIADIEWMENTSGITSPTQIAAAKVDSNWNCIDSFESFIKPYSREFHDWDHISYTGGTVSDFLRADIASEVLKKFLGWLSDDDIILWWYNDSKQRFEKLVNLILKTQISNKMININKYVSWFLEGQDCCHGNSYKIANARGIDTFSCLKHYSPNDVRVIRELMQKISFPQQWLNKPVEKQINTEQSTEYTRNLPYQYDFETNTVHSKKCPVISEGNIETKGYETLRNPVSKGAKVCQCCKKDFRQLIIERNTKAIEKSEYTYIYSPDSKIYHKRTCKAVLAAKNIKGARWYNSIEKTGREPCKICNPSPDDGERPSRAMRKLMSSKIHSAVIVSENDKRALNRQKTASAERKRKLQDDSLSQTEIKDIYTLTQPRFAFWAGHGYKTFHRHACSKLNGVSNLKGFCTYNEAVRAGYTPCKTCKPTAKHDALISVPIENRVRTDEKIDDIITLCKDEGFVFSVDKKDFYLETPVGKWIINISTLPIKLRHINLVIEPNASQYHEQPRIFLSLTDAFSYIKRHDETLEKSYIKEK